MNPALRLRELLGAGRAANLTGTVIAVDGQALKVRTSRGVIDARSVDATTYRDGDQVLVREGIVQGRVKNDADVPVYHV